MPTTRIKDGTEIQLATTHKDQLNADLLAFVKS